MLFVLIDEERESTERLGGALSRRWPEAELKVVSGAAAWEGALAGPTPLAMVASTPVSFGTPERLVAAARERWPRVPVAVVAKNGSAEEAAAAMRAGAADYLTLSPQAPERLVESLDAAVSRAESEASLAEAERRYREVFETLPVALYVSLADGTLVGANAAMVHLLSYPNLETLLGTNLGALYVDPRVRSGWLQKVLAEGVVRNFEVQLRRFDGCTIWVRETTRAVFGEGRQTVVLQGILEDVSERRTAEKALSEGEARYRTLFEASSDSVLLLDGERVVDCNARSMGMFACNAAEMLQASFHDLVPPQQLDGSQSREVIAQKIEAAYGGLAQVFEWQLKRHSGDPFEAELSLSRVDLVGRPYLHVIVRDVTARKRAEEALRRRSEELEILNRVNELLASTRDPRSVMQEIADVVKARCGVEHVSIALLDEAGVKLSFVAWSGEDALYHGVGLSKDGPGVVAKVVREGVACYLPDVTTSGCYLCADERVASEYAVPLLSSGTVLGVLNSESCTVDGIGEWERGVIDHLAAQAAVALRNASIYRRLETFEAQYRDFLEHTEDIIIFHDLDGRMVEVSPAAARLLGYGLDELVGRNLGDFVAGDVRAGFRDYLLQIADKGRSSGLLQVVTRDGRRRLLEYRNTLRKEARGTAVVFGVARDVTERWEAERSRQRYSERLDALRTIDRAVLAGESLADIGRIALRKLHSLVPCLRSSVVLLDQELGVGEVLAAVEEREVGLTEGSVRPIEELCDPEQLMAAGVVRVDDLALEPRRAVLDALFQRGASSALTVALQSGERMLGLLELVGLGTSAFNDEDVDAASRVGDELSLALHQAQLQTALAGERARLEALIEHLPEGVLVLDDARQVLLANPAAREALSLLAGVGEGQVLERLGTLPIAELLKRRASVSPQEIRLEGGRVRVFEALAREVGEGEGAEWVMVLREVTEQREVTRQLESQARLAAVGQLAAGVAHDFNNMLQAVLLQAELAKASVGADHPAAARIEAIQQQSLQGAGLIRHLLDFARSTGGAPQPLDMVPFIKEAVKLLRRAIPESFRIDLKLPTGAPRVVAEAAQLQQLITNLAMNARDAMPGGGEIAISLDEVEVGPGQRPPAPGVGPGRWVVLVVNDHGSGISPQLLDRIFDPFFTTKVGGKATGLGLSQVRGIVEQHSGSIAVTSELGKGSSFTVYLPAAKPDEAEVEQATPAEEPHGHGELILVVEDSRVVRQLAHDGLLALGYKVETAVDGEEAIAACERLGDQLALVLSDMIMPGIGGEDLARTLLARGGRARVVLMTGYPLEQGAAELEAAGIVGWLHKPFNLGQLARAVEAAVGRART